MEVRKQLSLAGFPEFVKSSREGEGSKCYVTEDAAVRCTVLCVRAGSIVYFVVQDEEEARKPMCMGG